MALSSSCFLRSASSASRRFCAAAASACCLARAAAASRSRWTAIWPRAACSFWALVAWRAAMACSHALDAPGLSAAAEGRARLAHAALLAPTGALVRSPPAVPPELAAALGRDMPMGMGRAPAPSSGGLATGAPPSEESEEESSRARGRPWLLEGPAWLALFEGKEGMEGMAPGMGKPGALREPVPREALLGAAPGRGMSGSWKGAEEKGFWLSWFMRWRLASSWALAAAIWCAWPPPPFLPPPGLLALAFLHELT
mmetsp:Transcript_2595/g.7416  ORF Transcript_2595/g.7416 Transcript_2595/m.7416 type:complete len:256 (+) Transcript_2595:856-1623(+)